MALWLTDIDPVELHANASEEDLQAVIRAVYKQVLGNAHIMESQRLASAESLLRNKSISVRDFVRFVAQSDLYRSLFFDTSSPYRLVELNFKHLLGRAPNDQKEIAEHVLTYNQHGLRAEIDSYIDSYEYSTNFGENTVPYACGNKSQVGQKNVSFNRTFALMRGDATSSSNTKAAKLIGDVAGNMATKIVSRASASGVYDNTGKRFLLTIIKSAAGVRSANSKTAITIGYDQLSQNIQRIQKSGGKILSISEV
jgi:phycoerythrin-associated linker protein